MSYTNFGKNLYRDPFITTLVYLIIVQDGINVQAGKIPKINKRAGWNKAVQAGIFHFLLVKIEVLA